MEFRICLWQQCERKGKENGGKINSRRYQCNRYSFISVQIPLVEALFLFLCDEEKLNQIWIKDGFLSKRYSDRATTDVCLEVDIFSFFVWNVAQFVCEKYNMRWVCLLSFYINELGVDEEDNNNKRIFCQTIPWEKYFMAFEGTNMFLVKPLQYPQWESEFTISRCFTG